MPDADDVKTALIQNAADGIARAVGDEGSVQKHSLPDQVAAHKYLKQLEAIDETASAGGGIRTSRLISPGAL
jgi:hypothetical protein